MECCIDNKNKENMLSTFLDCSSLHCKLLMQILALQFLRNSKKRHTLPCIHSTGFIIIILPE